MQRISVVGSSGSGKTTLARSISKRLGLEHLELDSIRHQANWEPLPDVEFRAAVAPLVTQDRWVIDGNYAPTGVQDVIWGRADTVIWLDLPRSTTMRRVVWRSLRRSVTREELWNGNRESWANLIHPDPEVNLLRWTWTRYDVTRERYQAAMEDPTLDHITWLRLVSQRDIDQFVSALTEGGNS